MAPSEGSQIESSQAKAAERHFPNDNSKSNEPKRASPRAGCHANAESEQKFRVAVPKERVPSEMYHAANPKRNINEGQIRSERSQAKGPKPTNPCERPFENDHNRPFPNDSHKRKFECEGSQANISSESQKANVIMRISRRSFQANVPSDSFQTTVRTRLFPSGNTHTKVSKRSPRTSFSE